MANYVFAAASFKPQTSAPQTIGIGGAAIAVGDAVYRDDATGKYYLADADNSTPASGGSTAPNARIDGLCCAACAGDGCPIGVVSGANSVIDTGATTTQVMAAGDTLVLSTTAGKLQPAPAASSSSARLIVAAVALTATQIKLVLQPGGLVP